MIDIIRDNQQAIADLCRQYGIRKLEVFGSAATGAFDPATSDIDFLVDLGGYERGVAKRYLHFAYALENLLRRRVDLVTESAITNPYFRYTIDRSREPVYEGGDSEAAA